jgi:hypothetical protein
MYLWCIRSKYFLYRRKHYTASWCIRACNVTIIPRHKRTQALLDTGSWTPVNYKPVIHNHYRQLAVVIILTVKNGPSAFIDPFCRHMTAYKLTATSVGPSNHLVHSNCFQCAIFCVSSETFHLNSVHIRPLYFNCVYTNSNNHKSNNYQQMHNVYIIFTIKTSYVFQTRWVIFRENSFVTLGLPWYNCVHYRSWLSAF